MFDRFFLQKNRKFDQIKKIFEITAFGPFFFLDSEFLCYKLLMDGQEKEVKKPSINNS